MREHKFKPTRPPQSKLAMHDRRVLRGTRVIVNTTSGRHVNVRGQIDQVCLLTGFVYVKCFDLARDEPYVIGPLSVNEWKRA